MNIVNSILKKARGKSRWVDHLCYKYYAHRKVQQLLTHNEDPILVYQMGKVGSSTIHKTLVSHGLGDRAFHIHFLSEDIAIHKRFLRKHNILPYHEYIYFGEVFRKHILKSDFRNIKVISLVREPIGLIVSNLFENSYQVKEVLDDNGAIVVEKAKEYLDRELKKDHIFKFFDEWFDRELKAVFDLDIYSKPFNRERGYETYSMQNGEVLLMRMDIIDEKAPKLLQNFLELDQPPSIEKSNVRHTSEIANDYKKLVQQIRIDKDTCERIYSRPLAQHFFTKTMIEEYINKWSK